MHLCCLLCAGLLLSRGLIQILAAEVDSCFGVITIIRPKVKMLKKSTFLYKGMAETCRPLKRVERGAASCFARYCSNSVEVGGAQAG